MNSLPRGERRVVNRHPVAAIRRKIRSGFIILGCLLLLSGTISWFELARLDRTTGALLEIGAHEFELSTHLFEDVEQPNDTLNARVARLQAEVVRADSLYRVGQADFERAFRAMQANAYRALMPGIITLIVAVLIIVIFSFMIDRYYVGPIIRMSRALGNFLNLKVPYRVKLEGRDEARTLSEQIETLISMLGKKENNS
jgi:methyl-accepting chemotaxis protein